MSTRAPWGHTSSHCVRCGKVGPRCRSITGGMIHAYCRTEEEKRAARQEYERTRFKPAKAGDAS